MQDIISELRSIKKAIGYSRLMDHTKTGFFIVSASRPQFSPEQNKERSEQLKAKIRSYGLAYVSMAGGYTELEGALAGQSTEESSFLVPLKGKGSDWGKNVAQHLGNSFDQESVFFCYPDREDFQDKYLLIFGDGSEMPVAKGMHINVDKAVEKYWSSLSKGSHRDRPFKFT